MFSGGGGGRHAPRWGGGGANFPFVPGLWRGLTYSEKKHNKEQFYQKTRIFWGAGPPPPRGGGRGGGTKGLGGGGGPISKGLYQILKGGAFFGEKGGGKF